MISIKKLLIQILQKLTSLETTYVSVSPESAISSANNKRCYLFKSGNSVRCLIGVGYADGTTKIPTNTTLFVLPVGYRPSSLRALPVMGHRTNHVTISANISIKADGSIYYSSTSDTTAFSGMVEWIVD